MKKIFYNKLVRDRIPFKIRKNGGASKTYRLKVSDFERELLKKIVEEASAVPKAKNRTELTAELADVIDVIEAIKKFKKIKPAEIKKAQKISYKVKGGFSRRLFLVWSSDTGYTTNEPHGKRRRT